MRHNILWGTKDALFQCQLQVYGGFYDLRDVDCALRKFELRPAAASPSVSERGRTQWRQSVCQSEWHGLPMRVGTYKYVIAPRFDRGVSVGCHASAECLGGMHAGDCA